MSGGLESYFDQSRRNARYKEIHLTKFRTDRDVRVARGWIDAFVEVDCFYRAIVIDWSTWKPEHFGDPFEPAALKKRRAYKKWAEMLLQPEFTDPLNPRKPIRKAELFLDRLLVVAGYDVIDHLRDRFTRNYQGKTPFIDSFQHTDSWRDANQCLQLCDLLTGCLYQRLVPAVSPLKLAPPAHLESALAAHGVKSLAPRFWRQYSPKTLRRHFPRFSAWSWKPTGRKK